MQILYNIGQEVRDTKTAENNFLSRLFWILLKAV